MGKDEPEAVSSFTPPGFAAPAFAAATQEAGRLFNLGPQQFFPGQTFAGFDPLQTQGQQAQVNFAQQTLPQLQSQLFGGFGQALDTDVTQDPSVQAALGEIERRGVRNFQESILPSLRRGATATGGEFGTRGDLAAGVAGRNLSEGIAGAQADFLASQLGSARQARGAALATAPSILQQGLLGGGILGQVGGQRQALEQQAIDEARQRFQFGQDAEGQNLERLIGRLGGLSGTFGTRTATETGGASSAGRAIGGALGGGLLGNALSAGTFLGAGPATGLATLGLGPVGIGGALLGALLS